MNAGKLRYLITIQRQDGTRDTAGNENVADANWKEFAKVWAHIDPWMGSARAGREVMTGGDEIQSLDWTRFHIRFLLGIRPKDRIRYDSPNGTRIFDIQAVNNRDERNYELELIAKELQ